MVLTLDMCIGHCGMECNSQCSLYDKTGTVFICDKCNCETDTLWEVGHKQLCEDCLLENFAITDGECEECGYEEDVLYDVNGTLLCEECLKEYFERVKDDE